MFKCFNNEYFSAPFNKTYFLSKMYLNLLLFLFTTFGQFKVHDDDN